MNNTVLKKWGTPLVILIIATAGGALIWKHYQKSEIPADFASGNGRIEATEYDIATKRSGRVVEVLVREGDMVDAGQMLARMDTEDLDAELREAEAVLRESREGKNYANAIVELRESELAYAKAELKRSLELVKEGHVSREKLDQDRTARQIAEAALRAARVQVVQSEAAIEAAVARTERLKTDIDDSVLKTPISGRILYRLAEPREILAAGGKVLTVLELTDVYMTIFLPTNQVGKITVGSDARIKLDAVPELTIPATVSFVAPEAQFTPREVETRTEREKLMFRIKVKIDPELLKGHIERVKTGLPGVAYVRLDQNSEWPAQLQVSLPQ
ncbi:MAG: HlyD family secretion protein [Gammaproteobacteria bacterium]